MNLMLSYNLPFPLLPPKLVSPRCPLIIVLQNTFPFVEVVRARTRKPGTGMKVIGVGNTQTRWLTVAVDRETRAFGYSARSLTLWQEKDG